MGSTHSASTMITTLVSGSPPAPAPWPSRGDLARWPEISLRGLAAARARAGMVGDDMVSGPALSLLEVAR